MADIYHPSRAELYPEIEPYGSGMLRLDSVHRMYWEQSGNPHGIPVLFLHGGPGAGAAGHVIGQHAYVLVDFAGADMGGITTGDQVTVTATGQGLALAEHPAVVVKNCAPGLLADLPGGTRADGKLEVHVAAMVPAEAIGAGAGMVSEYANTDLMGAYAGLGEDLSLGLDRSKLNGSIHVGVSDIINVAADLRSKRLELDGLPLAEQLRAVVADDLGRMDEQVLGLVPEVDEAEPSVGVEPSDSSLGHQILLISAMIAVVHCP